MRKRKYGHRGNSSRIDDVLVEDIQAFWDQKEELEDTPRASIHNLVGTAFIHCSVKPLNLFYVSRLLPNAIYDKQKFAAITIRLRNPQCTTLLFTSGKMVLTGCRDFLECVLASHEIVRLLRRGIMAAKFSLVHVAIQNIVGNVTINLERQRIDLDAIYANHNILCTFQKSMFPGLILRPNHSPVVLLIFNSGKIVITGGKSSNDVKEGWQNLWPFVRKYIVDA